MDASEEAAKDFFNMMLSTVDNPFSATAQDRKSMRFLWFR